MTLFVEFHNITENKQTMEEFHKTQEILYSFTMLGAWKKKNE